MSLMVITGLISLIFGIIFIVAPRLLARPFPKSNQRVWIEVDQTLLNYRISTGICLIAIGLFCISSAYYVWLRLNLY